MAALPIRTDIPPAELRRRARFERDGRVSARLIAIANALDGMRRDEAARLAGMDRQTLRDWVVRYNERGVAGLNNRTAPGRQPYLSEGQQAALKAIILAGPDPVRDGVCRWRIVDLVGLVEAKWGVRYSETGMLRLVGHSIYPTSRRAQHIPKPTAGRRSASKDPMRRRTAEPGRVWGPTSVPEETTSWRSRLQPRRPSPKDTRPRCSSHWN